MKILVCFKAVPDLDMMSDDDWVVDCELNVDISFVKAILNCFDESALEMTLKLSESMEGFNAPLNLTALTIGDKRKDSFLKTLYALRFDKAVRINNYEDIRFMPEVVAAVISKYVREIAYQDVIVLGRQSGEGDNAKTPLLLAEILGWPCITQVVKIELDDSASLKVTSMADDGILTQTLRTPCVLSVGNTPNSYMRIPTLRDKMKYGKTPIEVLDIESFDINPIVNTCKNDCELLSLKKISNNREGFIIDGRTPAEKAQILYDLYLKERLEEL